MKEYNFKEALPVWIENKEKEMNVTLILRAVLTGDTDAVLRIAAHTKYQIFINGGFFAEGPARAGHGFNRVSEYALKASLTESRNTVCIIAAGYNINSFYLTDEPSFVCAEIVTPDGIVFATGTDKAFEAAEDNHRVRKVQRYSFQRPFTEAYIYDAFYDMFITDPDFRARPCTVRPTEKKVFIERDTPYCDYEELKAKKICSKGIVTPSKKNIRFKDRSLDEISDRLKGYRKNELECCLSDEIYAYEGQITEPETYDYEPVKLEANGFALYDMGKNTTGFIRLSLTAEHDTVIYAVFNEKIPEGGLPDPGRLSCVNTVKWALQGGRAYDLVSFEPYTYRYIQIISMYAPCLITNVSQYRDCFPAGNITRLKKMPDEKLQAVYDAAVETFRQNATDIFMDCPSRERAGWLCDSFFTSRTEYALTGESKVEKAFLENFLMPEKFDCLPEGMLPMCYPSDHYDGTYIPNWAMWYVLELKEYIGRSGDTGIAGKAREKLYALADFFSRYENSDGLLQNLDSWVFIEWSKANDFTQDINYPTNMLYAEFLQSLSEIYKDPAFAKKAERVRSVVREQAFDGEFFADNAVIKAGRPVPTRNRTETAQYYAFFTGTATPETYPELYSKLMNEFGPVRNRTGAYPDIHRSNAFVGNYLRLEILFRNGSFEQLKKEAVDFFLPMALSTGTLWEYMEDSASCCHGFASHVAYWLNNI